MPIKGKPRIISMYNVDNNLTTGKELCLPSASNTPKGKESTILITAKNSVNTKPPQSFVDTSVKPNPPLISHKIIGKERTQIAGIQLTPPNPPLARGDEGGVGGSCLPVARVAGVG